MQNTNEGALNTQPPYNWEEGACLLIDKPLGLTSFAVVDRVRGALKRRLNLRNIKVGHAGTLDPLATGLLVLCTGKYTRRIEELMGQEKVYTGALRLGETTPSVDGETAVDAQYPTEHITKEAILAVSAQFLGEIQQVPPVFSAIKKDGKRAYESAREGVELELAARAVHIFELEFTKIELPKVEFRVRCSKGTYIRSLVRDIGQALGSGAWMTQLRREASGKHEAAAAWQLDSLLTFIGA